MTQNKDLKRLVRARMKKTGESYTAARSHLARKIATKSASKIDYAALAGMSDAAIKEKTGCTWEKWVKSLDYYGADKMEHRDIAKLVHEKYKVGPWWTQTVAVGYERIKGLRARGQRRDGTYEASKSRTFNVPVKTLYDAWANAASRKKFLDGKDLKVTTATSPKSMRVRWADGTIIALGFYPKGESKSSVAIQHTKLPDRETANALKKFWSERLDALAEILNP
ncbi:MAG TPA: hypothetical protein VJL35_05310 [Gemmatimonadaceae bacterium]|jgi:hypothetical protein|nr:hypothetical protein [Gemmatimonadaceae bacterium]